MMTSPLDYMLGKGKGSRMRAIPGILKVQLYCEGLKKGFLLHGSWA